MYIITDDNNNIKFVSKNARKVVFDETDMQYKDADDEDRWNAIFDEETNTIYPRSLGYKIMVYIGDMPELEEGISYDCYKYDGYGNFEPNMEMEQRKISIEERRRAAIIDDKSITADQDAIEYLLIKVAELEGRL